MAIREEILNKEEIKIDNKLIIEYHKRYKLRYIMISIILGVPAFHILANIMRDDVVTINETIQTLPAIVGLILIIFFTLDMIKWALERYGIFKPREVKLNEFATKYINNLYKNKKINSEQFNNLMNIYNE